MMPLVPPRLQSFFGSSTDSISEVDSVLGGLLRHTVARHFSFSCNHLVATLSFKLEIHTELHSSFTSSTSHS